MAIEVHALWVLPMPYGLVTRWRERGISQHRVNRCNADPWNPSEIEFLSSADSADFGRRGEGPWHPKLEEFLEF
jgi:hypothetical protein